MPGTALGDASLCFLSNARSHHARTEEVFLGVSLEAIFLSAFVLITQNRMSLEAERRADLHLHVDLLAEHEITRVLRMLDEVHQKLGIAQDQDHEELPELEEETRPEDVLAAIRHLEHEMKRKGIEVTP